jgi:DNA-binding beta-propeller fold protein YncE
MPQGFSPFALAITKDSKYAYIGFDISEVIFKMRLDDFTIEAVCELYEYFPMESQSIVLDTSESKLFVYTPTWRKLIVIDTRTMNVIHVIEGIGAREGMIHSEFGPFIITWDGSNSVQIINTETYDVTEFKDERVGFVKIQESKSDQGKWYVATQEGPGGAWVVGLYDYSTKAWMNRFSFPLQAKGEGIFDVKILPNEQKLYMATMGGWYLDYHAYGWLYSIDLVRGETEIIPIDGGATCLETSPDSTRLYVGTGWPMPDTNNLLVVDTESDNIVARINLGRNKYGWPPTQVNDLQIDTSNSRFLYATVSDANDLVKVDLSNFTIAETLVLNNENYRPHFFVRQPGQATGYIFIHQSNKAFELDLEKASIKGVVKLPLTRPDTYAYSGAIHDAGRLLLVLGESVLEINTEDMRLLGTHPLPQGLPSVWHVILSRDQKKLYSVACARGEEENKPNNFVAINTENFQVEAVLRLEGGSFCPRPFELPDGSKVYALGGLQNGQVVVQVIETEGYTITKTITFDEPGLSGIAVGLPSPFAYDPGSRTLFVGATHVVLAIDTDTDTIKKVIHLGDTASIVGVEGLQFTYINAAGLLYSPQENYLYIAHLDLSFISIYDLNTDQFLLQFIPLKGYFPAFIFANDDYSKIFVVTFRSDSISVIDVKLKAVEHIIDLHAY